jgi:hypothetical protein
MREKAIVVCTIIFTLCMLTVPVAADLIGYSIVKSSEKNMSLFLNSGDLNIQNTLPAKDVLTDSEKKLSSALLMQTSASRQAVSPVVKESFESSVRIKNVPVTSGSGGLQVPSGYLPSGKLVYVYVYVKPGYSTHIIDSSVNEVTNRDENYHIAVAWVDIQALEQLASLEGVRTIREVTTPVINTGSVTTAGDAIHKTVNVRSTYGNRGAGMKVGIISDGVDSLTSAIASGDLPADVTVLSNTHGGDEGTAMLEIVYDMAPDAKLYFHDVGSNNLAFNAAVDELVANGCMVICDDISWPSEPSFEDGIVASHIKAVLAGNNIIYISSAGNAGNKHYQGNYYKYGTTNWTDFSQGTSPTAPGIYVNLSTGSNVIIVLHWNDQWGHSGNDYDLYLHNMSGGIITYSRATQSGSGDPIEGFSYTHAGPMMDAQINVLNYNGLAQAKNLELFIFPSNGARVYLNNINPADSIFGHPAVPDVISVAAVPASSPATIEAFSSRGPVTISYPTQETRQKPDISGVDGVAITGAGGFSNPFYGTSASAPHIAAIVAQYWGAHPTMTPAQVRSALYTYADDLGSSGKDTIFGNGLANALKMAEGGTPESSPIVGNWNGDLSADAGLFRPSTGYWYFDYNLDGTVDKSFRYGGSTDQIINGDWDGDGSDGIAIFRPSTGYWYFDYNLDGVVDKSFRYGGSTDRIIKGNWQGTNDGIAIFRNSTGYWYFDYNLDGVVNKSFRYGGSTDQIVKGNWQGTNDGIAIFRNSTGYWYFDYNLDGVVDKSFRYGGSTDRIIVGKWQGANDGIAIFRPSTGYWYFDYNLDGVVDNSFRYGGSADQIIKGDWNGDGSEGIGIFRPSTGYWYLDYNLDGVVDKSFRLN